MNNLLPYSPTVLKSVHSQKRIILLAVTLLASNILLWKVLQNQNYKRVLNAIDSESNMIRHEMISRMESRIQALERMASRFALPGMYSSKSNLETDTKNVLRDFPGFEGIGFITPDLILTWSYPPNPSITLPLNLENDGLRRNAIKQAEQSKKAFLTKKVDLYVGGKGLLIFAPIFTSEKKFKGVLGGGLKYQTLLETILKEDLISGYSILLSDMNEPIYKRGEEDGRFAQFTHSDSITVGNRVWKLKIQPTQAKLAELKTHFTTVFLLASLALSTLLVLIFYFIHRSRIQMAELAVSNKNYRDLVSSVRDYAIFMLDLDGIIVSWDEGATSTYGYNREEVIGKPFSILYPNNQQNPCELFEYFQNTKNYEKYEVEEVQIRKDGTTFFTRVLINCIKEVSGKTTGYSVIVQDISKAKKDEITLRFQGEIINNMTEGVYIVRDSDKVIIFANPAIEKMLGYSSGELIGKNAIDFSVLSEDDLEKISTEIQAVIERDGNWIGEIEKKRKDGKRIWALASSSIASHPDHGKVWVSVQKDITPQKNDALELANKKYQLDYFVKHSPAAIAIFDTEMKYLFASLRWTEDYNLPYSPEELTGRSHFEIFKDLPEKWIEIINSALRGNVEKEEAQKWVQSDGKTVWVHGEVHPWKKSDGEIGGIFVFSENITERMEALEKLKRTEQKFKGLLEGAPDAVVIANQDGNIVLINAETQKLFGYNRQELIGKPIETLIPDHLKIKSPLQQKSYFKSPSGRDLIGLKKNGIEFPIEISLSPLQTEDGLLVMSAIRDITERKEIERQLRDQEAKTVYSSKMAALGQMAAGIGHEINNPLSIIKGTAEDLAYQMQLSDVPREHILEKLKMLENTSSRIAKIITGLRNFSREDSKSPYSTISLHNVVSETLSLCRHRIQTNNIELKCHPIPKEYDVDCHPAQLSQVLLNLLNNACDSIDPLKEKWIEIDFADLGNFFQLIFTDSGKGINSSVREKIFYPFFTTKEPGQGTGLGLSISRKIIEDHGGTLELNTASKHTQFIVQIPRKQSGLAHNSSEAVIPYDYNA